jgi:hypothetical protein
MEQRGFWQIHLSTLLITSLVAGGLMFVEAQFNMEFQIMVERILLRLTKADFVWLEPHGMIALYAMVNIPLLLAVLFMTEWLARRRKAR